MTKKLKILEDGYLSNVHALKELTLKSGPITKMGLQTQRNPHPNSNDILHFRWAHMHARTHNSQQLKQSSAK